MASITSDPTNYGYGTDLRYQQRQDYDVVHQRLLYRINDLTIDLVGREFIVRNGDCKPAKVTLLEVHPVATTSTGSWPQWCKWRGYQDGELFVNSTSNPEFELELLPLTDTPIDDDLSIVEAAAGVGVVHATPLPTREEILALAGPEWTIVDQLYCPLPPDSAAWVTEPNGSTLYLRTSNDGSRLWLRAPSHLSHAKILETLRNILERRQTVTWSHLGFMNAADREFMALQEKLSMFLETPLVRIKECVTHTASAERINNVMRDLDELFKDQEFSWNAASYQGGLLEHRLRPLTTLPVGARFRALFQGIDGEFVATRTQDGVSEWATILCTLQHPVLGKFTQIRLDDLLMVIPLATHCDGCDCEFDPPGTGYRHEVVLGVHPHQIFTDSCSDCYMSSLTRYDKPPPVQNKVYLQPEEPPPRKQLWDSWANPQWEEP